MINLKTKIFSAICAAAITISTCCVSVFAADDYSFDMTKAKPTYGGGQAFSSFTRLDNEKRDRHRFNPLWMTDDSQVIIEYESSEYTTESPVVFVLQSWTGDLVSGTEDKWVQINPTKLEENVAVWDYQTLIDSYGSNFSDVYCLVVEDGGENELTISSLTITNVNVPEDEIATLSDGVIIRDGVEYSVAEEPVTDITTEATDPRETTVESDTETMSATTSVTDESETTEATSAVTSAVTDNENEESSFPVGLVVAIAVSVVAVGAALVILFTKNKSKNNGWH